MQNVSCHIPFFQHFLLIISPSTLSSPHSKMFSEHQQSHVEQVQGPTLSCPFWVLLSCAAKLSIFLAIGPKFYSYRITNSNFRRKDSREKLINTKKKSFMCFFNPLFKKSYEVYKNKIPTALKHLH